MKRADAAQAAVDKYADLVGGEAAEPLETQITDLIADLLHLFTDDAGPDADVDALLSTARLHFESELPPESE